MGLGAEWALGAWRWPSRWRVLLATGRFLLDRRARRRQDALRGNALRGNASRCDRAFLSSRLAALAPLRSVVPDSVAFAKAPMQFIGRSLDIAIAERCASR